MTSPYTGVGGAARTETDYPLSLDAAKGQRLLDAAKEARIDRDAEEIEEASEDIQKVLRQPSEAHQWHGQQHTPYKFSLMDPVHPARIREDEPITKVEHAPLDYATVHQKVGETQPAPAQAPPQ